MTLHGERNEPAADAELVQRLLLTWRTRCAATGPWELTAGRGAIALCVAVIRTLELGAATPGLARAFRAWGAGVPSPVAARAALQCLCAAVTELVAAEYGQFRPRGLDYVLEHAARESVVADGRRTVPEVVDPLTGCPDRETLEHDLAPAVTAAAEAGEDLTVAVLELEAAGRPGTEGDRVDQGALLGLLASVRATFGRRIPVYRVGPGAFALVVRGVGSVEMGKLILLTTCGTGPRFVWGRAGLRAGGEAAESSPGLLLLLAEADLHMRRQDLADAQRTVDRRRQLSVVGSAAASVLLVAGLGAALAGAPGAPVTHAALHAHSGPRPQPSATGPPAISVPASPAPTAPPPALPAAPPTPTPAPRPAQPVNAAFGSYQAPLPPTATPPAPTPPAPPSPAAPPPPARPGRSGTAPGHLKGAVRAVIRL